ncbi:MAG TPA: hypothetical protein VFB99_12510 [Vicinamibacterales bacterium]|nr:hypothetical protein [Vicinamibacterales bacterium]
MSKPDLIAEAKRLAGFAPEKPESVHDVVCAGFNALYEQLEAAHKAVEDADADAQNAYVIASNVWREEYDKLKEQLEAAVAQIRLQHAALAAHGGGPCICEWCASTPSSRDEA